MADLGDRLRVVERVPVPDVWERASARSHDVPPGGSLPDPVAPRRQRIAAALVATAVAVAAIAFVVSAFGEQDLRPAEPSPSPVADLDGTSWVLMTIDGEAAIRGTEESWFTLKFRDGEFTADSGCGRVDGTYEINGGSLRTQVRGIGETFGACASALSEGHGPIVMSAFNDETEASVQGATLILDLGEHQLELVQDPCSVLTPNEVGAAVSGSVKSSALVPPSGLKVPNFGPLCSYTVVPQTPYSSISVHIETSTLQQFESEAAADEANFMDIPGIGELAYISGMNSIVIFDGSRSIEIGLQHGAGDDAVPVLEALGGAATDRDVVWEAIDPPGPPQTGTAPTTLVLDCATSGETRVSPRVEASPDGVHVKITGASPEVQFKGGLGVSIFGTRAEFVFSLAPGQNAVRCLDQHRTGDYVPFEVVDPEGLWVDPTIDSTLECPGRSEEVEYVDNQPLQVEGDPSDEMKAFTEDEFAGRFPGTGYAIPLGYPEAERPYFGFMTSSGSVLGIVGFYEGLPGDWLPEFYRACQF